MKEASHNPLVCLFVFACLSQLSTGEVLVQYNDGSKVKLQPSPGAAALTYTDPQGHHTQ